MFGCHVHVLYLGRLMFFCYCRIHDTCNVIGRGRVVDVDAYARVGCITAFIGLEERRCIV